MRNSLLASRPTRDCTRPPIASQYEQGVVEAGWVVLEGFGANSLRG
jgi:hypothetical protein